MKMRTGNSANCGSLKTIEPTTTLTDEGKFLRIVANLPGIAEERIKIDLETHLPSVTIIASDSTFQYKKVINLPCEVRFSKKRFFEEALELILEKTNSETL